MVRAPCCEKMGLKKGPWTPEEDQILVSYIHQHGHGNWRALPKLAGLPRCGKSCRLRWTNYLRPDIKRGNFSKEEEETIIQLHEKLGNRWSTIAARLPGRTDNEIKNAWHTHLKKRLKNHQITSSDTKQSKCGNSNVPSDESEYMEFNFPTQEGIGSPQPSSSELSSVTDINVQPNNKVMIDIKEEQIDSSSTFLEIDDSFWSEELSVENELQHRFPLSPIREAVNEYSYNVIDDGDMDFWYNLFIRAGGLPELPEF